MKILRITSLGYVGGGVEDGILLLQPVLKKMGHEVKILTSDHNPEVAHFSDHEFKALAYQPHLLKFLYRCFYPHAYFALKNVLREFQPDVVQIHSVFEVSPSVLFLLRKYPTIVTVHGAEDYTKGLLLWAFPLRFFKSTESLDIKNLTWSGWLHYLYHRYLSLPMYHLGFRNVDIFLVMSTYMQRMLQEEGIESVCVPNATRLFAPVPIDTKGATILYVGRLEKIKGIHHVIEALPLIAHKHPKVRLVVAGTGEYEENLQRLVTERGLTNRVQFVGHRNREQLQELYTQATVTVVPSVWPEPFGKVGIEAASVGRPVVASNVGGIAEWLIDGETGYLVPPEDPKALAEKLTVLLGNEELLQRMSKKAAEHAKNFTIETYAERVVDLYNKVVKKHRDK